VAIGARRALAGELLGQAAAPRLLAKQRTDAEKRS